MREGETGVAFAILVGWVKLFARPNMAGTFRGCWVAQEGLTQPTAIDEAAHG